MNPMIDYAKIVLWGVSFWKQLFRKELIKIINWCTPEELIQLKNYCYEKYYDLHPEIIDEAFLLDKKELIQVNIQGSYSRLKNKSYSGNS